MSSRPKSPDLAVKLEDPEEARKYIASFPWNTPDPPKYIVWGLEEKIFFDNMTDAEAVFAAKTLLRDIEIPMAHRSAQYERWEH